MHGGFGHPRPVAPQASGGTVTIASRGDLAALPEWQSAFAGERKDRRFYELLEDTITEGFEYGYLVLREGDAVRAIQPYFVLDQDLLAGSSPRLRAFVDGVRRLWPRFMIARTMMIGCSAGEGHLGGDEASNAANAALLASEIDRIARELKARMVVLKEFPAKYRDTLQCFVRAGFARVPSMPMTKLGIDYRSFDDYVSKALSPRTRGKVRRKLRDAARAEPPITMSVVEDVTPVVDEVYPLYLSVYERSAMKFEKLTKAFLCGLGERMPDKARFFVWRQGPHIIAFGLCMVHGLGICSEYVGFDYDVAFDLNLYYRVFRDTIQWAMDKGYKHFTSSSLNYDPKWHLRQLLDPIDLYVKHTSAPVNAVLKRILPLMEPTRADKTLPNFPNYRELWG